MMAKNGAMLVGVVIAVGFMVFTVALGSGLFRNFGVQDIDVDGPFPTPVHTPVSNQTFLQQALDWLKGLFDTPPGLLPLPGGF